MIFPHIDGVRNGMKILTPTLVEPIIPKAVAEYSPPSFTTTLCLKAEGKGNRKLKREIRHALCQVNINRKGLCKVTPGLKETNALLGQRAQEPC